MSWRYIATQAKSLLSLHIPSSPSVANVTQPTLRAKAPELG